MLKQLTFMIAAAMLFIGAGNLYAQSDKHCADKSSAECTAAMKAQCASKKSDACCKDGKKGNATSGVEFSQINKNELRSMINAGKVVVIDARDSESYSAGHIDGAVNLAANTLPKDKNATLVFYCGGPQCTLAPKAARMALNEGYKNVMVFSGGWSEWHNS